MKTARAIPTRPSNADAAGKDPRKRKPLDPALIVMVEERINSRCCASKKAQRKGS